MAGDRMAVAKGIPNGQVPAKVQKAGPLQSLDASRTQSARNTSKDYTNPKKWKFGNP